MPLRFLHAFAFFLLLTPALSAQTREGGAGEPRPETTPEKLPPPTAAPPLEAPACGPGGCVAPILERIIPRTQVLLVPEECATTMPAWKVREVEVARIPAPPVLDYHEEKQFVTEMRLEERECEQQVVCTESKPETVTCPETGHCTTVYKECPVIKTVKVKVYQVVPFQREVLVRVPVLKPSTAQLAVKKLVLDKTTVPAIERRFHAVTTHNEIKVAVPAPPCLPPPGH